jgi:ATPase family AAA domain-containing protein 3A/B
VSGYTHVAVLLVSCVRGDARAARRCQAIEDYKAKMASQRMEEENQRARARNQELVQMQLEAEAKKEAMRRAAEEEIQEQRRRTDEHRAKLERENMQARAIAEAEGRIREQRENQDLFLQQIRAKGEERAKRARESIETFFSSLGSSLSAFVSDRQKLTTTIVGITALAGGVYATREVRLTCAGVCA